MKRFAALSPYTGWLVALIFALLAAWFALGGPVDMDTIPADFSTASTRAPTFTGGEQRQINIYLPGDDGAALIARPANVTADAPVADQAREALAALAALDAQGPGLFPDGLTIHELFVYDDVAVINLKEGFQRSGMGAWTELLAVMSLVNTLALGFDEIEKAQILIDGKPAQTFAGHVWIERPLSPDTSLITAGGAAP